MKKFFVISTLCLATGAGVAMGVRSPSTPPSPLAHGTVLDPFRLQVVTATAVSGRMVPLPSDGFESTSEDNVRPGPFTPPPRSPYAPPPR